MKWMKKEAEIGLFFDVFLTTATLEVAHLQIIKVPLGSRRKSKSPKGVCIDKLCIDSTSIHDTSPAVLLYILVFSDNIMLFNIHNTSMPTSITPTVRVTATWSNDSAVGVQHSAGRSP